MAKQRLPGRLVYNNIYYILQITCKYKHCTDNIRTAIKTHVSTVKRNSTKQQTPNILYNTEHFFTYYRQHPRIATECTAT
jgi:hypothetical protein